MPRYFFHVHDGVSLCDRRGTDLPDTDAARTHAANVAAEFLRDHSQEFWKALHYRVEATDEADLTLFCITMVATEAPSQKKPPNPLLKQSA
jgi:hypothetical protein